MWSWLQPKDELGVSLQDLAKFGKAEFDMEPLADSFMSVINQPGKVRLGFKLWIEFMVRICCLPKERFLRLVFRAFDSSGVGKFGLTGTLAPVSIGNRIAALHFALILACNMIARVCLHQILVAWSSRFTPSSREVRLKT